MFSKKLHADVKKSTQKIQDVKKESPTRFKHLRIILENVDLEEAKVFFDANFSHIYYIFYDNFIIAETNLRQKVRRPLRPARLSLFVKSKYTQSNGTPRGWAGPGRSQWALCFSVRYCLEYSFHYVIVHKAHREELEAVLLTLDKILTLCPELLSRRWQVHSLSRIITKLLHPGNSWKLRREAIRFFLLWYQALGENAPDAVHAMFATLVPGFPSPIPDHPGLTGLTYQSSATVFHDVSHGPISAAEIQPVFPPQGGEKQPDDPMKFFLDALLEFMVTQVARVEWKDKIYKQHKSFMFLFDRFKMYYLPHMFPTFSHATSLYKPVLDLALLRPRFTSEDRKRVEPYINCRVAFIKWIANFTHSTKKDQPAHPFGRSASVTPSESEGERSPSSDLRRVSVGTSVTPSSSLTVTSDDSSSLIPFLAHSDHSLSEDPNITAINIVRDVLYGSRENVNMIHEVYRQAFLLNFAYSPAIRRAITVYKDWIQMNVPELPPFMLEPLDSHRSSGPSSAEYNSIESPDESSRQTRLRNDSYIGAVHKENLLVRAGLQNVLQVFITHAANVFLLEISQEFSVLLEEQVDTCKRVLNIYRYMVMHTHMEARTWEQLLLVLLQITSLILSKTPPKRKEDTLGGKLAPAIFQTLIVTWIKANLNVVISAELWDEFLAVLSSLTQWEELIREWAKTLDTLTRVLTRHVYNLDLNDLPLDRLSEQKSKRQKKSVSQRGSVGTDQTRDNDTPSEAKHTTDSASGPTVTLKSCESWPALRRSASESTLSWARRRRPYRRNHHDQTNTTHIPVLSSGVEQEVARIISGARPRQMVNGKSRSMDSIAHLSGDGSAYFDPELSRSPSPAPSSGVESNSFKESPMQIDMLSSDGTNIDQL
ncbi:Ral GTPase-activating protein subunit alpha-2 [Homalodisca vitripennis]|nr:Ral GTPase-activating protein subunit alpha-2 [Homalodisca vitripennis]